MFDDFKRLACLLAVLALAACSSLHLPERCDLLIVGGKVVDGTGAPARRADVAVVDGRIAALVPPHYRAATRTKAARVFDATGMVVAPGFVDVHAHGDPRRAPGFDNFAAMGVTTVCLGLDGSSPADDLDAWLSSVDARGAVTNIAAFVGHGTVRRLAEVPDGRPADATERERMAKLVGEALDAGAFGLSTGLEYTPGRFADAEELAAIARPVGARGLLVASHVRSEDDDQIEASVEELLDQCRAAPGARAHLSHAKIVHAHDEARAEALLAQLDAARATGLQVTADVYPYTASYTGLSILFPDWARDAEDYEAAAADRHEELAEHLRNRVLSRNGPDATLFGTGELAGRTLAEVADERGVAFEEVLIELGPRGGSAAYFVMDDAVMRRLLRDEHVMVASDGSPTMRHPRGHGSFARVLRRALDDDGLTLETAIHKMSGLPAATLDLDDRGTLETGHVADLLVFDPNAIEDRATFTDPYLKARGMQLVLVNGTAVLDGGEPTGERPGRALRRTDRD